MSSKKQILSAKKAELQELIGCYDYIYKNFSAKHRECVEVLDIIQSVIDRKKQEICLLK